ncbi:MAG TPA: ergothioneine biosynthesis protein EgtB [Acidobacteriaceae bacterium]|jgi:ergothioneine biosynthesis protein EgtB
MSAAAELSAPGLLTAFIATRRQSLALVSPLTPEDMMVQSCAEASPAKWHLAHTSWFFETFVLREFLAGYRPYDPNFVWLFNSYYNNVSDQPEKKLRASFSRPGIEAVLAYRNHVDDAIARLDQQGMPAEAAERIELGIHHEQQHQELLCYDIKHALWTNPLHPAYAEGGVFQSSAPPLRWLDFSGGLNEIGHAGHGFAYDNESPRHTVFLQPFMLASRAVTCAEYLAFIQDGGYTRADLWLSEGWDTVNAQQWKAPLYWRQVDGVWTIYTMRGIVPLSEMDATPVCHVSYFEADAYARWAGKRLPTEIEWEAAVAERVLCIPQNANMLESGQLHPVAAPDSDLDQVFGDVWEWTRSAYLGYPGYRAPAGALGEYNGKFMCNQMVLRGGSAVTPRSHIRSTYRNFFSPAARWQFAGFRMAQDSSQASSRTQLFPSRGKDTSQ